MIPRHIDRALALVLPALAAAALGIVAAKQPAIGGACVLVSVALSAQALARRFPEKALVYGVFALLVAGTMFRNRPATASLSNEVDAQVAVEIGLYGLFAVTLAVVVRATRLRLGRMGLGEKLLLGYVALAALSVIWSRAPMLTLVRSAQLAILYAGALVLVRLLDPPRVIRALWLPLTWYVILFATLALVFPWAKGGVNASAGMRFSWFSEHPIGAASVAGIAVVFLGARLASPAREDGGRQRLLFIVLGAALVGIVLSTRSRGPLAAMVGGIAAAVMMQRLRPAATALLTAGALLAVFASEVSGLTIVKLLASWASDYGPVATFLLRDQDVSDVVEFSGRWELWKGTAPLFLERPWLGSGYQGSRAELLAVMPWAGHAHNVAMESLLDLGLAGSILLFVAFGSSFLVGPVLKPGIPSTLRTVRATIIAIGVFELLNGTSDEVFAGAPKYQTLLVLTCICLADRLRRQAGTAKPQPAFSAARAPNLVGLRPESRLPAASTAHPVPSSVHSSSPTTTGRAR